MHSVNNVKFQWAFYCLNNTVTLNSALTVKWQLMTQLTETESLLLKNLLNNNTKVSLTFNCWLFFNCQFYITIIIYFIDWVWIYYEKLLAFKFVHKKHTESNLTFTLNYVIVKHHLKDCILIIIIDNIFNNKTIYAELVKLLKERNTEMKLISINK